MSWFSDLEAKDQLAVLSVLIAGVSLAITLIRDLRARQRERFDLRQSFFRQMEEWAAEVVSTMSEASFACELDPAQMPQHAFFNLRHELRWRLSALIDRGRWYFPNLKEEEQGADKPPAYRGYRQQALTCIVDVLSVVTALDYRSPASNHGARSRSVLAKRDFTSEIQLVLDPRGRGREFRRLTSTAFIPGRN